MFGLPSIPWGLLGVAGGADTRPTNSPQDMTALQKLYAAVAAQNRTPNGHVARGFEQFGPQTPAASPAPHMLPTVAVAPPQGAAAGPQGGASAPQMDPGALSPQVAAAPPVSAPPVPMPQAGPVMAPVTQAAPAAGDGYSRWNGLDFGPSPSPASQASGPDVIQKLMSYFKNKENPSS
jgi:hypothetical protein